MASVQQLEKLHQIQASLIYYVTSTNISHAIFKQRIFYVADSLEATVAGERVAQIISRTEQLIKQRAFLRDERRRLRISAENLEERKAALKTMRRNDWIPASLTHHTLAKPKHIRINIGGLMFEAPLFVLQRDPKSLLSQLCGPDPPILPDKDGFFYFDRDWWLFRYILSFMRDGTLPDDRNVLSQLYREGSFWNLVEMQRAIEEEKLHLRSTLTGSINARDKDIWWRKLPSWWQAVDEAKNKESEEALTKKKKEDWWVDSSYNGKTFLPLSSAVDKVTAKPGDKDAVAVTTCLTWKTRSEGDKLRNEATRDSDRYVSPFSHN